MDLHPPQNPLRSIADFGLHILTVTIGILIALGFDALVQMHRDHVLADHARADFREELTHSQTAILADQPRLAAIQAELEGLIEYGQLRLANKPATPPKLAESRSFVFARSAAWETAVATQALLHLPFAEARAISAAYAKQSAFNDMENRAEAQWIGLAAFGDPAAIDPADIKPALQQVTIAYAYVRSLENTEEGLATDYTAALAALPPAD